jgi:hypothetical protein
MVDDDCYEHELNLDRLASSSHQVGFPTGQKVRKTINEGLQLYLGEFIYGQRQSQVLDREFFNSAWEVLMN